MFGECLDWICIICCTFSDHLRPIWLIITRWVPINPLWKNNIIIRTLILHHTLPCLLRILYKPLHKLLLPLLLIPQYLIYLLNPLQFKFLILQYSIYIKPLGLRWQHWTDSIWFHRTGSLRHGPKLSHPQLWSPWHSWVCIPQSPVIFQWDLRWEVYAQSEEDFFICDLTILWELSGDGLDCGWWDWDTIIFEYSKEFLFCYRTLFIYNSENR